MRTANRTLRRPSVLAALLVTCSLAFACARTAEPAPTAPAAEPPPPPAPAPAADKAPAEEATPEAPAAAPVAPRDLLQDREQNGPATEAAKPAGDELTSAQAELERSRVELNRALASAALGTAESGRARSTAGGASRGSAAAAAPKAEKKSDESSCSTACHAFSSLERAASAVCRITGEKDGRCGHAHAVVADAQKRVAICSCSPE